MNRLSAIVAAVVLLLVIGITFGTFTVKETERALKFRLGEVVRTDFEPGLYFQIPFVNNVRKVDARVQTLDESPQRFLTSEQKNLIVDTFVKWRVEDVEQYYITVRASPREANLRLSEIVRDGLRAEFGKRTVQEVISGDRAEIMNLLTDAASQAGNSLGVSVLDVRLQRVDLPEGVSESVFNRMVAAREQVARQFRAEGQEEAERIRSAADRRREEILAEARRKAEEVRGAADADATRIYADAYEADEEFYRFYRSLRAYENTFNDDTDMLVLSPDSEFFRYFDQLDSLTTSP
ncbi:MULTISPECIES: protease modulator HflC [Spiribacter]|jgi:membrane protease subunit HflC|uniref:Protein HflC n=1 Tax=Spiribacter aquaticus TaxID=1935996 RepID=A0A557RK26_9GAMM|nr:MULTISPECIES: protease modulator HflC [Spiribacter]KAF0279957.1 HflC protein [Spiribacter roseus]KAF0283609.1 HflC protein [Spiribacter roseus]TVO65518.1 protease modulator HflC [Spiribacter aquaticus]